MTRGIMVSTSLKNPGQAIRRIFNHQGVIACLVIFALATAVMMPIFGHGLPPINDAFAHYRWASGFIDGLAEGSLYPRWLANPNHGAGSPAMIYYPPLPFYVDAACWLITGNTLKAIALGCWLGLALSGITMYIFARSFFPHVASLLAAALYILMPYHILDLYQRAAISEFWAFVWVPLVFYSIRRVVTGGGWRAVALLAISYSLLLLTHVLTAFATTLVIPIYVLFITTDWRRLSKTVAALALGVGLSAIFVMPLILERGYVRIHRIHMTKYPKYFLVENLPAALKSEPLAAGQDPQSFYQEPDYFFHEASLLISTLLFALSSIWIWKRRTSAPPGDHGFGGLRAIWTVTLLSLLMTTPLSKPIWRVIPGLPFMQFPFRWLLIASIGVSLLSAAACSAVMAQRGRTRAAYGAIILSLLAAVLTTSILEIAGQQRGEQQIPPEASKLEVSEYRPRGWNYKERQENMEPVVVSGGEASVRAIDETGARQSYEIAATTESALKFRTLSFPGWVARLDGRPIDQGSPEEGHIQVLVPAGEHLLTLSFEDTMPRVAGKLISAFCFLTTLGILYCARRKNGFSAETTP